MKHYKSLEFWQFYHCWTPCTNVKQPVEDFVATVLWPSLHYQSFLSSVQPPFFETVQGRVENKRSGSPECRTLHCFIPAQIHTCMLLRFIAMYCSLWNTRSCSGLKLGAGNRVIAPTQKFSIALWKHQKNFSVVRWNIKLHACWIPEDIR